MIMVEATWAAVMKMRPAPIGAPIVRARRRASMEKRTSASLPRMARSGDFTSRMYPRHAMPITSERIVPRAAPCTPSPAPGIRRLTPNRVRSRVSKMRKKLKMTSSTHMPTLMTEGVLMSPLERSMPLESQHRMENGKAAVTSRK